jgi:hypothetical protein
MPAFASRDLLVTFVPHPYWDHRIGESTQVTSPHLACDVSYALALTAEDSPARDCLRKGEMPSQLYVSSRCGTKNAAKALVLQLARLYFGTYQDFSNSFSKLDRSHLGGKGIEIRSSPHCTRSADLKVPTPCRPHSDKALSSLHPTSLTTPLPTRPQALRATCFCGSLRETDPQKVARVFVESLTVAVCYTAKWLKSSSKQSDEYAASTQEEEGRGFYNSSSLPAWFWVLAPLSGPKNHQATAWLRPPKTRCNRLSKAV